MEYERCCKNSGLEKTTIEKADIVCIVNPCNPTGIYKNVYDMKKELEKCKKDSVIIIDESMQLWVGENFRKDSMMQYQKDNIFIIHSWTKFFSCTGLRIGSLLCPTMESYHLLLSHQVPWSVNILALEYIDKAITDDEYINDTWNSIRKLRSTQIEMLQSSFPDWKVKGADFLSWYWVELPNSDIAKFAYELSKTNGTPIRWGNVGYHKDNFIRFAVRNMESFKSLLYIWKSYITPIKVEMKLVELKDLKCHEHIIEERGEKLYQYLQSLEYPTIPSIIVDKHTNVIIDGHHRFYALTKMNVKHILVSTIDYLSNKHQIIVHPSNSDITHEHIINVGLSNDKLQPKSSQHMMRKDDKLIPIISLSSIVSL
jgi:hypothetical protein